MVRAKGKNRYSQKTKFSAKFSSSASQEDGWGKEIF